MNQTIALQRQVRELKEHLQDAVALASKYKPHMGMIDQEELARISAPVTGVRFDAKAFDVADRNGEQ
ncbi:MAG: hypothetical protein EOO85_18445 [Pedobacter sp.]|nr:MAG: hypothetical protein EOO85_18445 [Pedobacter sp.]